MGKQLERKILKGKNREIKQLRKSFDVSTIRNAAFSVGTEFSSPRIALRENEAAPVVVPLLSILQDSGATIQNYQPFKLARLLNRMNVRVFLVATDRDFLGGDPSHINLVKSGTQAAVIQYDFIIDEVQIYQAKSIGADGILLDSRLVDKKALSDLARISFEMGLEPFLRIKSYDDLEFIDLENTGGIIIKANIKPDIKWAAKLKENDIPVIRQGIPDSNRQYGIADEDKNMLFLIPENWLLQKNPVEYLAAVIRKYSSGSESH